MKRVAFISMVMVVVFIPPNLHSQTLRDRRSGTSAEILDIQIDGCTDPHSNPISFTRTSMKEFLIGVQWCPQIPIGTVLLPDSDTRSYDFRPLSLKLRDVFESIVAAEPRYQWSVEDGVINIVPRVDYPVLLDVPINEFKVDNSRIEFMLDQLESLPQVRRRAREIGLQHRDLKLYLSLLGRANLSLDCKDTSVKGVLNAVSKIRNTMWIYQEYYFEGKRYYSFH